MLSNDRDTGSFNKRALETSSTVVSKQKYQKTKFNTTEANMKLILVVICAWHDAIQLENIQENMTPHCMILV